MHNELDLCFLQAFFYMVRFLLPILEKARSRTLFGEKAQEIIQFQDLQNNAVLQEGAANVYVVGMKAEKYFFYLTATN